MQQAWKDLLFLHYQVPCAVLRNKVPRELTLDTLDGNAWVSIVLLKVRQMRFRWLPPLPTATNFLQLNLRTYVTNRGRSGIYFFSLDVSSTLSVVGARAVHLPCYGARMALTGNTGFAFRSERISREHTPAKLLADYRPGTTPRTPGRTDAWLLERYRLFQPGCAGRMITIDIHHVPWALRDADITIHANTLTSPLGFSLPDQVSLAHYARCQHVVVWPPRVG